MQSFGCMPFYYRLPLRGAPAQRVRGGYFSHGHRPATLQSPSVPAPLKGSPFSVGANIVRPRNLAAAAKLPGRTLCAPTLTFDFTFLLLPLQPKHFKLRIPIQPIFRKFLGQYIPLSRAVKLQGIPVFLHVGQIAGQGGLLAFKFGLAVP